MVFTHPTNPSTFTPEDVLLWGPDGRIPITAISFVGAIAGRETYRASFPLQQKNDAVGNRIEVIDSRSPLPPGEGQGEGLYTTNNMNQYTSVGGATYTFDADGNMTSKTEGGVTTTYTYDIENRLIGVTAPTDAWAYNYDALGNRIASTHNGVAVNYVVDPIGYGDVAAEYDSNGDLIARYDHGFGLIDRTDAGSVAAYYTFDAIGSTNELTSATGSVLNTYSYDPFGISLAKSESVSNSFQYVGEYGVMHEGNGLEFMRARCYSATMGRFVSADPIGVNGGLNLYRYARNDPVSLSDPRGTNVGWDVFLHILFHCEDAGGGIDEAETKKIKDKYEKEQSDAWKETKAREDEYKKKMEAAKSNAEALKNDYKKKMEAAKNNTEALECGK